MTFAARVLVLLTLAGPLGWSPVWAQQDLAIKVRLTLSLARFTQWPSVDPSTTEALRLCVLHRSPPVFSSFRGKAGEFVNGSRLLVMEAPSSGVAGCHVLFVHASAPAFAEHVHDAVRRSVLTVGDGDGFVAAGGMVELVPVNDAVRFDVNLAVLRAAHLVLSSQVLRLARQVRE